VKDDQTIAIFDFDGTLVDTLDIYIKIFEKLTKRPQPFEKEEIERLRGMTALRIARELRIRPWRVSWLLVRGRALMRRRMLEVEVFPGIEAMLKNLDEAGIPMFIMSTSSPGNIQKLLKARGMDRYFQHIYGNVGVFGKAKMLRKILEKNKLAAEDVFYIGDEARDIEATKRVGIRGIAVAWGFNSPELLERHRPFALVRSPKELEALIKKGRGIDGV
jgi:phosphoglycolate phosphatase-like HAD superfamily hydrolase